MSKFLFLSVLFLGSVSSAGGAPHYSKIADCTQAAHQNEPEQHFQVFRMGSDRNDAGALLVRFSSEKGDNIFSVDGIQWLDDGNTLSLRFANFIVLQIRNGKSTDSKAGVVLGAPANNMSCDASL